MIAVRVSIYAVPLPYPYYGPTAMRTLDFHFWKKDPKTGKWWHKPGSGAIVCLGKINPDNINNWRRGYESFPHTIIGNRVYVYRIMTFYNSKTIYLAYKGKFWTK